MAGIVADAARCADLAGRSPALVTGLVPFVGYEVAAKAARLVGEHGVALVDALAQVGVDLDADPRLREAIDPGRLARGG